MSHVLSTLYPLTHLVLTTPLQDWLLLLPHLIADETEIQSGSDTCLTHILLKWWCYHLNLGGLTNRIEGRDQR